jgi:EAL domain-containing protein (putative c-di-GMP-specific phosphodiesterase class I)
VTLYPQDGADAEQLMRHADQAMYQAKQSGKNRYHLFDVATDNAIKSRSEQIDRIHQALRGHEMVLFYQPKVNMHTGQLVGAEALIRWQHPDKGLLAPGHFLPVLEGQALSTELDEWVLAQVFDQLSHWQQLGLMLPVGVNISSTSLQGPSFVQHLSGLQARYPHLPASLIELEVLETSALQDLTATADIMRACREMGVRFALDDFGTGYSSLGYLHRFPLLTLKIDRSFVAPLTSPTANQGSASAAVVRAVVALAGSLGLSVVAEGIETQAQADALCALGCHLGQGFLFAKPGPLPASSA